MKLIELIYLLKTIDPDKVVLNGFGEPMSYRGFYEQLAFEPVSNTTIGSMLEYAESAADSTFEGYKGGMYHMDLGTECWIANYGETTDVPISVSNYISWTKDEIKGFDTGKVFETFTIKNLRDIKCLTFDFDSSRLHAFVGDNRVGKTSVLQALSYCYYTNKQDPTSFFDGARQTVLVLPYSSTVEGGDSLPFALRLNESILFLDNLGHDRHPKSQQKIMLGIKEIIKNNPDQQVFLATHSPYILQHLEYSQVHVLCAGEDGFTRTKRLDKHPDADWAKQRLDAGEFWDAEGEDWVLDTEVPALPDRC
jgi:AAA domain